MRIDDLEYLKCFKSYVEKLEQFAKTNKKQASKDAMTHLIKSGYINENGEILPPYNGQKVNENDFTRGPKQKKYEK